MDILHYNFRVTNSFLLFINCADKIPLICAESVSGRGPKENYEHTVSLIILLQHSRELTKEENRGHSQICSTLRNEAERQQTILSGNWCIRVGV